MDKEHLMLLEGIQETKVLINKLDKSLVQELNVLKLVQQKLRYYIYGVALFALVALGKPEMITAIFKI